MSDTELTSPEQPEQAPVEVVETSTPTLEDLISDDLLKNHPQLEKFLKQPIDVLAKSHVHANSLVGKRVENMTAEEIISFNKKLGVPDRSDDYSFAKETELPQDEVRALKDKFFKFGINQVAAEHMFNDVLENTHKATEKVVINTEQKKEENINKLIEKFGSTYKGMLDLIEQELLEQGGLDLRNRVLDPVSMDHQVLDVFAKLVKEKRAQGLLNPSPTAQVALTPADIDQKIAMIKASPEFRDASARRDRNALMAFSTEIENLLRVKLLRK